MVKQWHFVRELLMYAGKCRISFSFELGDMGARASTFSPLFPLFLEDAIIGLLVVWPGNIDNLY